MIFGFFFTLFYSFFHGIFQLASFILKGVGKILTSLVKIVSKKTGGRRI